MVDYRVAPQALRKNATEFYDIADAWTNSKNKLSGAHMATDDLGLLGKLENVPASHNAALNNVLDRLGKGFEALNSAAETLKKIADEYESRDAKYYRKYGYLDERIGG